MFNLVNKAVFSSNLLFVVAVVVKPALKTIKFDKIH